MFTFATSSVAVPSCVGDGHLERLDLPVEAVLEQVVAQELEVAGMRLERPAARAAERDHRLDHRGADVGADVEKALAAKRLGLAAPVGEDGRDRLELVALVRAVGEDAEPDRLVGGRDEVARAARVDGNDRRVALRAEEEALARPRLAVAAVVQRQLRERAGQAAPGFRGACGEPRGQTPARQPVEADASDIRRSDPG